MQFSVSFDSSSPDLGSLTAAQQQEVLNSVNAAAAVWAWYLTPANITLNISIDIDASLFSGDVLAQGGPDELIDTGNSVGGKKVYDADTDIELRTGQAPAGTTPTIDIGLTPNAIQNLLYFSTSAYSTVPGNLADAVSVFMHEIGHGLGIISGTDDSSFPGETLYDTFIQNGTFTGANAEAAYGQYLGNSQTRPPLPLQPGSLSHLEESSNLGTDLMSPDLPDGTSIGVSAVDLGILEDLGVPLNLPNGSGTYHALPGVTLQLGSGTETGYALPRGSTIYAGNGNDTLIGGASTDYLYAGTGNDTLIGGGGNDYLYGGNGNAVAVYSGPASDYQITHLSRTSVQITDLRPGSPDGTDTLYNIQQAEWSDGTFTNLTADNPPVVTTANLTEYKNQNIPLSSLFTVTDADGDSIAEYQLWESTRDPNAGHFVVGGIAQPAGTVINLSYTQLSSAYFVTGTVSAALQIRAYDGYEWSAADNAAWAPFTITIVDAPPVVSTGAPPETPNTTLPLSSLFTVTDADGDTMTKYELWESTRDPNAGHFVVNGVAQQAGTVIDITTAQLAQTSFVTGTINADLQIRAFDGQEWSAADNAAWAPFTITVLQDAPVVTASNVTEPTDTLIPFSGLFSVSDPLGTPITEYEIQEPSSNSPDGTIQNFGPSTGVLVINGVVQPSFTTINIPASELSQVYLETGTEYGNSFQVSAFNGTTWSSTSITNATTFTVSLSGPLHKRPEFTLGQRVSPILPNSDFTAVGTNAAQRNQTLTTEAFALFFDADGNAATEYQIEDNTTAANSGTLEVNGVAQAAGTVITLTPAQWAETTFVTGTIGADIQARAFDGVEWSASPFNPNFYWAPSDLMWSNLQISVPDTAPVVSAPNISSLHSQTLALSSLFTATDADGDAITQYQISEDTSDPNAGYWVVNGAAQPAATTITLTPAQVAQTSFVTGTDSATLEIHAYDGAEWSTGATFTVSILPDNPPVVTTTNLTEGHYQTLALSSLFTVTDAENDPITQYQLWDSTRDPRSGGFVVNGVAQAAGTVITISAAQLAQTSFVTGEVGASLQIRADDGTAWSAAADASWAPFTISVPDTAPVVTTSNVTEPHLQSLALSSLFSVSDADGDPITQYQLWDSTGDPNSGAFAVNGAAQPAHTVITISAAQLSQTTFTTGSVGASLQIRAFDGVAWSAADNAAWAPFTVMVSPDNAPVVTTGTVNAMHGRTLALSSLFSVSDADGDPMTQYQLWDSTRDPTSGYFTVNGVAQPAGTVITISAAQLAQTDFVTGEVSNSLQIRAFDGIDWSAADNAAWSPFNVDVTPYTAPVVNTSDVNATINTSLSLSSLFMVSDPDGDTMTKYELWESTRDPNAGHFVVNGTAEQAGTVIDITAAQLAQTSFLTGTIGAALQIRAFDGISWSAADNAAWSPFHVNVS